jgi:hypothetical protein
MATWPARTWTPGELVTASIMNGVRDELEQLRGRAISITFGDVAGAVLTTGVKGYLPVPIGLTITGWTIIGDAVGSIVVDVWKAAYPTVPTVANTIAGSEKPTLASAQVGQDLSLSSWTTTIAAGDVLGFNIDSITILKQVTLVLNVSVA